MSPIKHRRFQEIEELSRELFPEEKGSQHQLSEDRRLAIRELLQEQAELRSMQYLLCYNSATRNSPACYRRLDRGGG